jgi:polysaccharide export outer membrane protein
MRSGSRNPPTRALDGLILAAGLVLAGCGFMPTAGPTARQVFDQASRSGGAHFEIVDIDSNAIAALRAAPKASLCDRFPQKGPPVDPAIGVGDTVVVTIWEAADGGLFSGPANTQNGPGAHSVTLPPQLIGRDGAISVPFAGRIAVAGRLPLDVQHAIEKRLNGKALDPQAIVTVDKSVSHTATVEGEVVKGAVVPLSPKGNRLLDLIAVAGEPTPPYTRSRYGFRAAAQPRRFRWNCWSLSHGKTFTLSRAMS